MEKLSIDPVTAARMGHDDVRATFTTGNRFIEIALLGPGCHAGAWSVAVHQGCDPDDPAAGSSGMRSFPDEDSAIRAFREEVWEQELAVSGERALARTVRQSIESGTPLPRQVLERIAARLERKPSVFFTVSGGMGEVRAVDGEVLVYNVDLDREGDILEDADIDAILRPAEMSGTPLEVAKATEESREALSRFKADPAP